MKKFWLQLSVLVLLLVSSTALWLQRQSLWDWYHLRGYSVPSDVVQLATDTTMTDYARHLFYVNRPVITDSNFTASCKTVGEKTAVLGCYVGVDRGIYIYDVKDKRLHGVEQVTAAHEMLHAAYGRLSAKERKRVDGMVQDFYKHQLHDERILKTVDAYRQSEPNDIANEMHSLFGTEVVSLTPELESYYKKYFVRRAAITEYSAQYEAEFTGRRDQVAQYDSQLADLKKQIETNMAQLSAKKTSLDASSKRLDGLRANGQREAYNSGVVEYNAAVEVYQQMQDETKSLIEQYNTIVNQRNALVMEEQQLAQELSSSVVGE